MFDLLETPQEKKKNIINITPFIDILLILVGFFILLMAQNIKESQAARHFYVKLPVLTDSHEHQVEKNHTEKNIVCFILQEEGSIRWAYENHRGEKVDSQEQNVQTFLAEQFADQKPENMIMMVHKDTRFEKVIYYQNLLKKNGVKNIGFSVSRES